MTQWIAAIARGHNSGVCLLKDGELVYDGKVNDVSDQDFENIYGRAIKSSDLLGEDD